VLNDQHATRAVMGHFVGNTPEHEPCNAAHPAIPYHDESALTSSAILMSGLCRRHLLPGLWIAMGTPSRSASARVRSLMAPACRRSLSISI